MQAEAAASIESAPARIAETMKALWRRANDRGVPKEQRDQAWRAMSRMMARENVQAALESLVRAGDGELGVVVRQVDAVITRGARAANLPVRQYRAGLVRQGMGEDAMLVAETLEREVASRLAQTRLQIRDLETVAIPKLEAQAAQAEMAAKVATGRAQQRAIARWQGIETRLAQARQQLDALNARLYAPENAPLARTEQVLGIRMMPAERAPVLARLQDTGTIAPQSVVYEVVGAGERVGRMLTSARERVAADPVSKAMAESVEGSTMQGSKPLSTTLEETLLSGLRSDEVARAVRARHGEAAETAFREAVGEGNLEAALGKLEALGRQYDTLLSLTRHLNQRMAQDFTVLATLGERAAAAIGGGAETAGVFGNSFRSMGQRFGDWWVQSWARGAARALFRRPVGEPGSPGYGEYSIFTRYFLQAGREILRTTPEGMTMERLGGYGRIGLQVAIWGAEAYYLGNKLYNMYGMIAGSGTVDEGLALCRQNGYQCSDENARFIRSAAGAEFFTYLPTIFPVRDERRPGNRGDLQKALERPGILIDPERVNEVLDDGRAMAGRLDDINALLGRRRGGEAAASGELNAIIQPWGISLQQVDDLLERYARRQAGA